MIRMVEGIRVVYRYKENLEVKGLVIPRAVGLTPSRCIVGIG